MVRSDYLRPARRSLQPGPWFTFFRTCHPPEIRHAEPEQLTQFSASLRGRIVQPGDADYDASRRVYNAMIDRRPRLIVHCRDVADVMHSVGFAREQSLLLAVRGGGHSEGGLGTCDDGLVIDLSGLNGIRVDAAARTVRVEAGAPGPMWITPPTPSAWPRPAASSAPPAWAG